MSLRNVGALLVCLAAVSCDEKGDLKVPLSEDPEAVNCDGLADLEAGVESFFQRARTVLEVGDILDSEKLEGNLLGENGKAEFSPVLVGKDTAYQCASILGNSSILDRCVEVEISRMDDGLVRFDGDVRENLSIQDTDGFNGTVKLSRKNLLGGDEARVMTLDDGGCKLATLENEEVLGVEDLKRVCWRKCEAVFVNVRNRTSNFIGDAREQVKKMNGKKK